MVFMDYFKGVYVTSYLTEMKQIFQAIENKVNEEMNVALLREFTSTKVEYAFNQMNANKALGLDSMTRCFYKKYWSIVGQDITRIILGFLNGDEQLEAINHTNVVIIPKKKITLHS